MTAFYFSDSPQVYYVYLGLVVLGLVAWYLSNRVPKKPCKVEGCLHRCDPTPDKIEVTRSQNSLCVICRNLYDQHPTYSWQFTVPPDIRLGYRHSYRLCSGRFVYISNFSMDPEVRSTYLDEAE